MLHLPQHYFHTIPAAPELGQSRKVDIAKLRDIRKRLDNGQISVKELEVIAVECLDELVELCSGKMETILKNRNEPIPVYRLYRQHGHSTII